jgi:pyroglutamyl-peptidase
MTTVLLTGFEPFAGDATNPSGDAVRLVGEAWTGGERLVTAVLPVAFARAAERMRELIDAHSPDVILATGLAGGRAAVTPERVAINLADARIRDNDGARPIDEPSVPGAPAAAFATLPVKAIAAALVDAGIPSAVSYTAGTFVCNHVMFTALDAVADRPGVRAGFVHLPWCTGAEPAGAPSLPMSDIVRAIDIAIRTSIDTTRDPMLAVRDASREL